MSTDIASIISKDINSVVIVGAGTMHQIVMGHDAGAQIIRAPSESQSVVQMGGTDQPQLITLSTQGPTGGGTIGGATTPIDDRSMIRVDTDHDTIVYRGYASVVDPSDSDPVWRIARKTITFDPISVKTEYADGFTNVWTNRTNLTYR